jgi:hypothetical protein
MPPGTGPCPVADAGGWRAWVNRMPGPDRPKLWVTGRVTAPTGGYRVWLELGPVQEIHPPIQQVLVRAQPPSGPATQSIVTHDVSASFEAMPEYGAVTIRCGSQVLADIRPVEQAH